MELSGHEWQRAEEELGWGVPKGHRGRGKAGGGQDPVVSAHSSDGQPSRCGLLGEGLSLIRGGGRAAVKVHGVVRGVLPLWPALVNNLISSLSLALARSLSLSLSLFFCLFLGLVFLHLSSPLACFQSAVRMTITFNPQGRRRAKSSSEPRHLGEQEALAWRGHLGQGTGQGVPLSLSLSLSFVQGES